MSLWLSILTFGLLSALSGGVCNEDMETTVSTFGTPDAIRVDPVGSRETWYYKRIDRKISFEGNGDRCLFQHTEYETYKNEPEGFRGIAWGTDKKKIRNLRKLGKEKSTPDLYKIINDPMEVGGVRATVIYYEFYKDRLASVIIGFSGLSNCQKIHEVLTVRHDEGMQTNTYSKRYAWLGDSTTMMFEAETGDSCNILMMSSEIANQVKADQAAAAVENADKGF